MLLCPTCGRENPEGARFCRFCGQRIAPDDHGQACADGFKMVADALQKVV
jgi:uncharacterized membrane protein YvbJ